MKKLAMSFITYNRAKHIREDLAIIAQPTKECDIDIYIYDGSTNMQTKQVVDEYLQEGYNHIHYLHTDKHISVIDSIYQRVTDALLAPDAEYVWMCGDKFVIRPDHYLEILSYIDRSYDIITIYGYPLKETRRFDNARSYVNCAIVPITHYGSTIIKKKLIESFNIWKACEECPSFGVQLTYLRAIADVEGFKGVVIDKGTQTSIESQYQTPSSSESQMWTSWVVNWYRFVELLPPVYEDIREGLYNRPDLQAGFFSRKELLRQRSEGQFDWKKCWECKEYIKKVIVMPNVYVFGIAILPRCVVKRLYKLKHCKCLYKFKH